MKDWYNDEEIWNSLPEKERKRLQPFKPMVARLARFGYAVSSFDPGVKFFIDGQRAEMNNAAWVVFDKALVQIEALRERLDGILSSENIQ